MNLHDAVTTIQSSLEKEAVLKFEANGYTAYIVPDEDATSPADWDNFGHFTHWHRREWMFATEQNIGDGKQWDTPEEFVRQAEKEHWIYLPVAMLDHSGITVWVGSRNHWCDPGGWDSGQVGYIYVTPEEVRKEYSCKRITKKVREKAEALLTAEVKTWDLYYTGQVYGHLIFDANGEEVDSCWGYYGDADELAAEVKAEIENMANHPEIDHNAPIVEVKCLNCGRTYSIQGAKSLTMETCAYCPKEESHANQEADTEKAG